MSTFYLLDEEGDRVDVHDTYEEALAAARAEVEDTGAMLQVAFVVADIEPVPAEVEVTEYDWRWA